MRVPRLQIVTAVMKLGLLPCPTFLRNALSR